MDNSHFQELGRRRAAREREEGEVPELQIREDRSAG